MSKMKKKTNAISTVFLVVLLLVGVSVMLYPTVSDLWNRHVSARVISDYQELVDNTSKEDIARMLDEAHDYNRRLAMLQAPLSQYDEVSGYEETLDVTGTGIMGYVNIPAVRVSLPIYHGTSEGVLQIAAGHLQGSTLPVGGANTHGVISAHRGLPSARLFTDIDKIVVGDIFTVNVLDQVYTYEVEEILIVLPEQVEELAIIPDSDYMTLLTCTPYGINTHRLLLRSRRIAGAAESIGAKAPADAIQVDPMIVVPIIAAPLVVMLLIFWFTAGRDKRPNYEDINIQLKYKL